MDIEIIIKGTSSLLMHNPQMVDPNHPVCRQIKELTKKRTKTEDDLRNIEVLEWHGGMYTASVKGQVVITQPSSKVRKCLINAARITKQGKQIERAIIMTSLDVPLLYDGSEKVSDIKSELDRLINIPEYTSRLSVRVGNSRVMRVRPQFMTWGLIVPAVYMPDAGLNFDDLQRVASLAGVAERIGDNRVNGYGAFDVCVRQLGTKPEVKPTMAAVRKFFDDLDKKGAA